MGIRETRVDLFSCINGIDWKDTNNDFDSKLR